MITQARHVFLMIVAIAVTALLTSLVWLLLFNLRDKTVARQAANQLAAVPAPAPSGPAPRAAPLPVGETVLAAPGAAVDAAAEQAILKAKALTIPVSGVAPGQLVDTFTQTRGGGARPHDAIDILAARGTPVVAVEDGRIAKLFLSKLGGTTIYQFDPGERFAYYYAHLDRYADGLAEGQTIRRGTVIGYVGYTGDAIASAPHLHFAIDRLGPEKHWWQGVALNPYPALGGTLRGGGPLSPP